MRELPILMNGPMVPFSTSGVDQLPFVSRYPSATERALGESHTLELSAPIGVRRVSGEIARRTELTKRIALIRSQLGAVHG